MPVFKQKKKKSIQYIKFLTTIFWLGSIFQTLSYSTPNQILVIPPKNVRATVENLFSTPEFKTLARKKGTILYDLIERRFLYSS